MEHVDLRSLCMALGFTAVILKGEAGGRQALRARTIAGLIESFCTMPDPEFPSVSCKNIGAGNSGVESILAEADCPDALRTAMNALQLIMNDGLTFSSEQVAEHALEKLRKACGESA